MKSGMLNKMKKILREIWKDFRDPGLHHIAGNNCCGYDLPFETSYLQPQPVKVKKGDNHFKNFN